MVVGIGQVEIAAAIDRQTLGPKELCGRAGSVCAARSSCLARQRAHCSSSGHPAQRVVQSVRHVDIARTIDGDPRRTVEARCAAGAVGAAGTSGQPGKGCYRAGGSDNLADRMVVGVGEVKIASSVRGDSRRIIEPCGAACTVAVATAHGLACERADRQRRRNNDVCSGGHRGGVETRPDARAIVSPNSIVVGRARIQAADGLGCNVANVQVLISGQEATERILGGYVQPVANCPVDAVPVSRKPGGNHAAGNACDYGRRHDRQDGGARCHVALGRIRCEALVLVAVHRRRGARDDQRSGCRSAVRCGVVERGPQVPAVSGYLPLVSRRRISGRCCSEGSAVAAHRGLACRLGRKYRCRIYIQCDCIAGGAAGNIGQKASVLTTVQGSRHSGDC